MPSLTPIVLLPAVPTLAKSGLDSPSVVLVLVLSTALAGGLAALLFPAVSARLMNDDDDEVCMCCTEKQQTYILLQFMMSSDPFPGSLNSFDQIGLLQALRLLDIVFASIHYYLQLRFGLALPFKLL
jgi:hypothetical protein